MLEIRIHGRGGQGVVTAAYLLSIAGFKDKFYTQAFPKFGTERTGSPVESYVRLSKKPIITRSPIKEPNYILVLDPSLIDVVNVWSGLKDFAIINTSKNIKQKNIKIATVNLNKIYPGINNSKMLNVAMLSAFIAITNIININSFIDALSHLFKGEILRKNKEITEIIYTKVRKELIK